MNGGNPVRAIKFAHLSDTHFDCNGASEFVRKLSREHSTRQRLVDVLAKLSELDFILLTGDLVHEGEVEDYRAFRRIFDTYAPSTPIFCTAGNHDKRPEFRKGFLGENATNAPYLYSNTYADLRVICLDSAFDYGIRGYISPRQTEWLGEELSRPYGRGTIVLSHHPIVCAAAGMSAEIDQDFARIVSNSDVIGFFNGHTHSGCYSYYLGRPHITAESMSFGIEMTASEAVYSSRTGFSVGSIVGTDISVATKIVPAHFIQLQRKLLL